MHLLFVGARLLVYVVCVRTVGSNEAEGEAEQERRVLR